MKSTESIFLTSQCYAISYRYTDSKPKHPDPMVLSSSRLAVTLSLPHDWLQPAPDCGNLYAIDHRFSASSVLRTYFRHPGPFGPVPWVQGRSPILFSCCR